MLSSIKTTSLFVVAAFVFVGCSYKDIPLEFPTVPQNSPATPIAKITLKPDTALEKEVAEIAKEAKGKVGVAAILLETGDSAMLNGDERFPMQSVYKLPISMVVMDQVRLGQLALDEKIGVTKDDMVRAGMRSPLRDENPSGGEFAIRELIRLAIVESDGTASDVLMRIGGATEMQSFLTQIGIREMKVTNTEKELGGDWELQYANYSSAMAAVEVLRWLDSMSKPVPLDNAGGVDLDANANPTSGDDLSETQLLLKFMAESNPGAKRLKGDLPPGTYVAHKTGTSGTQSGITAATNDIGIVRLPSGRRFAIAVFVSDSPADEKTREAVIAKITKAVWDSWNRL